MAEIVFSTVLAVLLSCVWYLVYLLGRRTKRTEDALIATLRLVADQHTGELPRDLSQYLGANHGGVHRG